MRAKRVANYESRDPKMVSYWPTESGAWMIYFPDVDLLGNLTNHTVVEHLDETITVSPSIKVWRTYGDLAEKHGYLTKGEWKDC